MTHPEIEELIDLYVIGALPEEERREVSAHLGSCASCHSLAAASREVAQVLRLSVDPVEPPPELRGRLMAAVRARVPTPATGSAEPSQPWWRALFGWLYPAQLTPGALGVTLVPLLLCAWLALQVVQLRSDVSANEAALASSWATSQSAAEIMAKAMEHGGNMASLQGTEMAPMASGTLYYVPSEPDAVLVVRGLPELSNGHEYQCWLVMGERRMNAGTVYREKDGRAMLIVKAPMPLDAVESMGLTDEPNGGRYVWGRVKVI